MSRTLFAGIALAVSLFLSVLPLQAEPNPIETEQARIAELEQRSQDAIAGGKWASAYVANLKLNRLRPGERQYLVDAVRACGMLDRKTAAYHLMLQMQQQGMAYDFNQVAETEQIRSTEAYEYINNLLIEALNPAGVGLPVFTLQGDPAHFDSLAWDNSREKFLVGTVEKGEILAVTDTGESDVLIKAADSGGSRSINGLAVDAKRKRLWVSSSVNESGEASGGSTSSLVEFDLESLEALASFNLPADTAPRELGSVAIAEDGTVYVIDRKSPVIYRKSPSTDRLEAFFSSPELRALVDIAVAPDNSRVFVADAYKGVLVIDPVAEQASFLSGPDTLNLGGARGIEYQGGQLFLVQGGFSPPRVVRLELDSVSGALVETVSPMAIGLEQFNQPGVGTIRGGDLFYFANSGQAGAEGAIVMSTPLDAGNEVAPPDMSKFEDAIRAHSQSQ